LLLLDVAEELVTLVSTLGSQVKQVILKAAVSGLPCLPLTLVSMFAHALHVAVDCVGTLGIHHKWVSRVVSVRNVFTVYRLADSVVQLLITVSVEGSLIGDTLFVEEHVDFLNTRHQTGRFSHAGGESAHVSCLVFKVVQAR